MIVNLESVAAVGGSSFAALIAVCFADMSFVAGANIGARTYLAPAPPRQPLPHPA